MPSALAIYLWAVGVLNIAAVPITIIATRAPDKFDWLFRRVMYMDMTRYDHGEHGAMWAFMTGLFFWFFGLVNFCAGFLPDKD